MRVVLLALTLLLAALPAGALEHDPLLDAVIGWGDDSLGVPQSRAARDHPRVVLYRGWTGRSTAADYFAEASWPKNATSNHEADWIAGNLRADYQRGRRTALDWLRREIATGVQYGETGSAIYSPHWHASRAVIVASALERRDQELYDVALTSWALQCWLEEATEARSGPRAGESRRAGLRTGDPQGWDPEGDHLRHLVLREPTLPETERRIANARRALATPRPADAAGRARWLTQAVGAGSWMEAFVVADVLAKHPEIHIPVDRVSPPRVRSGEYVIRRYELGVESLWRGSVRVMYHGLPMWAVRVRESDGRVEVSGWPQMVGRDAAGRPDFRAGLRIEGDLQARPLPSAAGLGRLVSEVVLGPGTPVPTVVKVPLPGGPVEPDEPEPDADARCVELWRAVEAVCPR